MNWLCGALSFLWLCPSPELMTNADFDAHLKFFTHLDIVLSVPEDVCPEITEYQMQFNAIGHLEYDQKLGTEISKKKIGLNSFTEKMKTCTEDCTCGALLTLEEKVSPKLKKVQSKKLQDRLELLTKDYYKACQKKIQLTCDSPLVVKISKRAKREE